MSLFPIVDTLSFFNWVFIHKGNGASGDFDFAFFLCFFFSSSLVGGRMFLGNFDLNILLLSNKLCTTHFVSVSVLLFIGFLLFGF